MHSARRAMKTPRWIGDGSFAWASIASQPTCIRMPARLSGIFTRTNEPGLASSPGIVAGSIPYTFARFAFTYATSDE